MFHREDSFLMLLVPEEWNGEHKPPDVLIWKCLEEGTLLRGNGVQDVQVGSDMFISTEGGPQYMQTLSIGRPS